MKSISTILWAATAAMVFSACPVKDKKNKKADSKQTLTQAYHFKYHTIVRGLERDCANSKLDERLYWLSDKEEDALRPIKVSLEDEVKIGEQVHAHFSKIGFVQGEGQQKVQTIVDKMKPFMTRQELTLTVNVVDLPYVNAFACPGGHMYVTKPLLEELSDDELSCVIGHEISHLENKHCNIHIKKSKIMGNLLSNLLSNLTQSLSQRNEVEADLGGVYLAYKAGYNPRGSIKAFNRWAALEGNPTTLGKLFRSHPYLSTRVQCINAYLDDAQKKAKALRSIK